MIGRRAAGALLLPLLVAGCSGTEQSPHRPVAAPASLAPTTTTTSAPAAASLTVQEIVDGRTFLLSDGTKVQVAGLAQPGECWAAAAAAFARPMLLGKEVRINRSLGAVSPVTLADGTDYALLALGQGVARPEGTPEGAASEALTAAQQVPLGLWGPPCDGVDVKPTPPPPPPPPPAPTTTTTKPPRPRFFVSCDEARRAGAAPIHWTDPSYRRDLDRNGNGIACE